ncbi:MAG: hypothetical protein AB2A00_11265 [Myxococcota bacterium]
MRMQRLLGVFVVGGWLGCTQPAVSGDAGVVGDGGTTGRDGSALVDAGHQGPTDASHQNSDASDGADAGGQSHDAGVGTDAGTATDAGPHPECGEYIDLEHFIVRCPVTPYEYVFRWDDVDMDPACPDYWTVGDDPTHYPSRDDAVDSKLCDDSCIFSAYASVMFLHCGFRNEYIHWTSDGEGCGDLYEYSTGIYTSREAWEAENPCPDAGVTEDGGVASDAG